MVTWYNFGEFIDSPEITPEIVQKIYADAASKTAAVREIPLIQIASVLDRVRRKLQEPNHPVRQEIMRIMPELIHFSKEMVESGLDAICEILTYENLIKRVAIDLGDERYLDEFVYHAQFRGSVRAMPEGIVSHVSAGNVFVSAVDTLAQGMITKNVNILKMSSFDPVFPLLFAKLVQECDPEGAVYPYFALIPFRGGDTGVEKIVKEKSDVVIVYGGKETVEAYRGGRGLHTKEIEYGPKYSLVILDQEALDRRNTDEVAEQVARDFTMWEQAACSSPHCVFVRGEANARKFAQSLKMAFEKMAREFPFPDINVDEKTEITRTRELARVESALGRSEVIIPAVNDQSWTIILDKSSRFNVSCQHRTAYVVAANNDEEIFEALSGYGKFIQSIGMLASPARLFELSNRLVAIGADRVTDIGRMHKRKHGTPHDGTRGVAELVRWVSLAQSGRFDDPLDFDTTERRNAFLLARVNRVLGVAREKSSFYKDRIPSEPLKTIAELEK
ncbi:MAG TPA: CoF synthetase, partial [Bdellovibrionales bacterium]|nr:CoF synthetase [Bdellovibrionales bacterium]